MRGANAISARSGLFEMADYCDQIRLGSRAAIAAVLCTMLSCIAGYLNAASRYGAPALAAIRARASKPDPNQQKWLTIYAEVIAYSGGVCWPIQAQPPRSDVRFINRTPITLPSFPESWSMGAGPVHDLSNSQCGVPAFFIDDWTKHHQSSPPTPPFFVPRLESDRMWVLYEYALGWPFRALAARDELRILDHGEPFFGPIGGWPLITTSTWNIRLFHDPMFPPRIVLWRGLILDVLFYSVLIGAWPFSRGVARPWFRRRRGRCEKCGYALAGLAADAPCPECGKPASFTRANSSPSPLPTAARVSRPASAPAVSAGRARRP